jgi:general secretion pathway protein G
MRDAWGNPYEYLRIAGPSPPNRGQLRKDKNLVPINSDFDLYSMGPDGDSKKPLTAKASRDDIIRAADGAFVGAAEDY